MSCKSPNYDDLSLIQCFPPNKDFRLCFYGVRCQMPHNATRTVREVLSMSAVVRAWIYLASVKEESTIGAVFDRNPI